MAIDLAPSPRFAFIQGLWLSVIFGLGTFYWIATTLVEFSQMSRFGGMLALVLHGLSGQLQFPVFAWCLKKHRADCRKSLFSPLYFAFLYTGIDWLLPKFFINSLGHSLYKSPILRQAADLGGALLLTFVIFSVNYAIWQALQRWRSHRSLKSVGSIILMPMFFVIATGFYGFWRLRDIQARELDPDERVRFALIQPNIGSFLKVAAETGIASALNQVVDTLTSLSEQAMNANPKPQVLVWPETSYPFLYLEQRLPEVRKYNERINNLVKKYQVPIVFGGNNLERGKIFNSIFLVYPPAKLGDVQVYHKKILIPLGEYIPGFDIFPIFRKIFSHHEHFEPGAQTEAPLNLPLRIRNAVHDFLIAPIICYEALFSDYVISKVNLGSRLILNLTNDSWFGPWGEPQMHLSLVTFRSIETRLPQIRATNTGISALILPSGEISVATKIGSREILQIEVPIIRNTWTLLKIWGDWFGLFSLLAALITMGGQLTLTKAPLRSSDHAKSKKMRS